MNRFISIVAAFVSLCAASAQANNLITTFDESGLNTEMIIGGQMLNADWYATTDASGGKVFTAETNHPIGLGIDYAYRPETGLIINAFELHDTSYGTSALTVKFGKHSFDDTSFANFGRIMDQYLAAEKRSDPADAGDLLISTAPSNQNIITWSNDSVNIRDFTAQDSWGLDAIARSDPADAGYLLVASQSFGM